MSLDPPLMRDVLNGVLNSRVNSSGLFSSFDWYKKTQAELDAGVQPSNYSYPPGVVDRYGTNATPGTTDMGVAFRSAVSAASAGGGGTVMCLPGNTYRITVGGPTVMTIDSCLQITANVSLNLNGSTINSEVGSGNQVGIWLYGNNTHIYGGTHNVIGSGSPSSQYFFQAGLNVGLPNNMGDSATSPVVGQFMRGWSIKDMTISTTRDFAPGIGVIGGANTGRIEGCIFPSNAHMGACVGMDWGNTGSVSSSAIAATKTAYLAGTAYTTHPNNIDIVNCRAGFMSVTTAGDLGSACVRISACYNIRIDGFYADSVGLAGFLHTGGDLGFEFARAEDRRQAYSGTVCRRMSINNPASLLSGAIVDTLADNVYREQFISGYVPLANPLYHGNVLIEDCSFSGQNTDTTYGVRTIQARGVTVRNCRMQRWYHGVFVDEMSYDILIDNNLVTANRREGIMVGFAQLREGTERVEIRGNRVYGNGTDTTSNGIRVKRGKSVWIHHNLCGSDGESTQNFGLGIVDGAGASADIRVDDNHCLGATVAGYGILNSTPADALMYRVMTSFNNNTAGYGLTSLESGALYLPLRSRLIGTSRAQEWLNPNSSAPTDGTWYRGDKLWQTAETAANPLGHSVTTSGTFGTAATITNGATTNASPTFTCGIAGVTVNTTISTYSVVVSSATGLRAGMKCSIASAGITDAFILDVSGTTLQLDTQANATQSGGAFVTAGLVEGEVISVNTTTAKAGAVILKITGNSVTIDSNFVDTQSGRTVTYTTPVFKAWAAIAA